MLNPNLLRNHIEFVFKNLARRGFSLDVKQFTEMEKKRKILQTKVEELQSRHNTLSKHIGRIKLIHPNIQCMKERIITLKKKIDVMKKELKILLEQIHIFLMNIPNLPDINIPDGMGSDDNQEVSRWGIIKNYNFKIKNHVELGNHLNGFDWKSAANISGSRFFIMKGKIALLYRVLGQFMLDLHTNEHGYLETYVPCLVKTNNLYGTGQLPRFKTDLFYAKSLLDESQNNNNFALIPTAEVPLTNLFRDCILDEQQLPIMLVAKTPCFRSEALSYGRDTQGLIRTHQFDKVEIVQIVHPSDSMQKLEELTIHAERVLKLLKLPYRKTLLCTRDIGFSSSKTYDLEVWFPSQNVYREVSSCSNMLDFQARRIKARFHCNAQNKKIFIHTINGSGLAVGRTLAAILENYQQKDGRIKIPKILRNNYMNGLEFLE
ncbi:seryl-tRNA synthetase [Buchnera aphidicola str. Bp (Baizongia pistaciae)]|uniref:Serine--tRNA ligase n=1 Tax=Buchnera aphidicola subsp. Baizongia pistaciae (strain Bp) TaxID=224915 RepID=SYS_BUCBP|nr:serine--tRNA ligase [Buchnera aphidicola]P59553.1 RecName: Full=Serine--tRNA ligase; AltName: Full=Seryl-tRNA synthetase; Short=SerRS; AltName: Full=Seryl-tRNA(Ser/Sec) synthetase [Buchnera aphidicola str. Bp (Baizongia pistaciae)]AAO27015.1 seryl-tRNA synthetase [Buchnera aphidicola str. Bp (Baizongia pistaciae)]